MPKVSITLPCYNGEAYIGEAIESILNQTHPNFELVIVNDGSTDNTKKVIQQYLYDNRIKFIESKNNKGLSEARNKTIEESTGEYIGFIDCDDRWLPDKLEKQLKYLENNEDVDFVHSDVYHIDSTGKIIGQRKNKVPHDNATKKEFLKRLFLGNFIIQITVLARRKSFEKAGLFDPKLKVSPDYDMWLRIAKEFNTGYIEAPLAKKRYHENNLSGNYTQMFKDWQIILSKTINNNPHLERYKKKRLSLMHFGVANAAYYRHNIKEAKADILKALYYDFFNLWDKRWLKLLLKIYPLSYLS